MDSEVLALIPARAGSKGISNKNFRRLAGMSPVARAAVTAALAHCDRIVVSSDAFQDVTQLMKVAVFEYLPRPDRLAGDNTAMIEVVVHALGEIPGPPDQIIVLLQPTQPLRTPDHVRRAIEILREDERADSVVSVVQLPATHHADFQLDLDTETGLLYGQTRALWEAPARRQSTNPVYIRDGTVYAFRRRTVLEHGDIYGANTRSIVIPATETCALDTQADWSEAERRIRGA